jgi:glycogen(starch) synthase
MKVLMFGWEFPPHIAGGLGTACYGLTKGLYHAGVDVIFVVPRLHGGEDRSFLEIQGANDVTVTQRNFKYDEFLQSLTYLEVGVHLVPYLSPEEYSHASTEEAISLQKTGETVFSTRFEFTGAYGKDLMAEVAKYAVVGSAIAREKEFDVIHAHDWLTYPAGIAAKRASGKPLVIHVHATEFDRS